MLVQRWDAPSGKNLADAFIEEPGVMFEKHHEKHQPKTPKRCRFPEELEAYDDELGTRPGVVYRSEVGTRSVCKLRGKPQSVQR